MVHLSEITTDQLLSIITDESIWDGASADGQQKESIIPSGLPLGAYFGETLMGVFLVFLDTPTTISVHIAILKKYRGIKTISAVREFMSWFIGAKSLYKLNAEVPEYNTTAIKLAKHFGFTEEGTNKKSIMKNGKLINQVRLGITKEQAIICHQQ